MEELSDYDALCKYLLSEKLFWQIFYSEGEKELFEIVDSNNLLKNPENWKPYGGSENNFATFQNQQSDSGAALVEKITNSIDALLLKKCKEKGVNPESKKAPKTMEEATKKFFNIPKGDLSKFENRAALARRSIQIIATGEEKSLDLMIWDDGEGQHPDDFENTFLSLNKGNKVKIHFVQGKYNMGAAGAVVFCGEYKYQLLASKKSQAIFDEEKKHRKNLFGWTLVRKHILTEKEQNRKATWYEYFTIDGKIPQFEIEELEIGLKGRKFKTGSFIKLFSYEMPKATKGALHIDLKRELDQLLYKLALPIWLWEKREKYKNLEKKFGILEMGVYGNYTKLHFDNNQDVIEANVFTEVKGKEMGEVHVQAFVLKKGDGKQQQDRKRNYIGTGRNVIYLQNGQVHGKEGLTFIDQDLGFHYLRDSMLIAVECSKMKPSFSQEVFMSNRSNTKETKQLKTLKEKIAEALKNNETLKEINEARKNAMLQGGNNKEGKELIDNILSKIPLSKSLVNLLNGEGDLEVEEEQKNEPKSKAKKHTEPFEGKRFPAIFKNNLLENDEGKKIKSIPLNKSGHIPFQTDVEEDYFYRPEEPGELQIKYLGRAK